MSDLSPLEDKSKRNLISPGDADEAEIEASRAPLMEHLLELRTRLIWMVIAFAVAFGICFYVAGDIYIFLLHPLDMAGRIFEEQRAAGHKAGPFDLVEVLFGLKAAPAIVAGMAKGPSLIYTSPLEFFFTKMKVAMFGAVILSFPIIAWQLYRFVAPGLYRRERNAFLPFLFAAPLLFVLGAALVYFMILPMVLWFALSQQIMTPGVSVTAMFKVSDYLQLVTTLMLAFGMCFQLPIVITLLGLAGIVTSKMLSTFRRYAILGIVIVAAVVTPPDPISQLMLSIPIVLLYEISIWCVKVVEFRKPKATA
ncbi:MAG TPA: twin-arginine translocase subunit TatC [Asticcacaulis sp.]|nr:twin-arginine translocase subunit TatC [Asticcacaulis sp.]